jgi:hypothetical protein
MLTTSQKQIIAQIELEFSKMNNSESFDYLSLLDSKLNELENWKKEMNIQTKEFRSIATHKKDSIVSIFRNICEKYGFELSFYKEQEIDRWVYSIKMNGYTNKTYNGFEYTPKIEFKITMQIRYTNNFYHLDSSNLSFMKYVNREDVWYNDSDKFIRQIIEDIIEVTKYSKKVN